MTQRGEHYDDLEIRDPERREAALFEALRDQIGCDIAEVRARG